MTHRIAGWLRRYLAAELGGTMSALACAWAASVFDGRPSATALAGLVGETFAYYGTMLTRELLARDARTVRIVVRDLLLEFGPAEVLDSLLLRPALLYYGVVFAPNPAVGIVAGKLIADCTFYVPSIVSFEWWRRHKAPAVEEIPQ